MSVSKGAKGPSRGGRPQVLGLPRVVFVGAGLLVVAAVVFHVWIGKHADGAKVAWWGVLGDSAGPFSALFNAGALLAALSAIHLQRIESHESGESTRQQLRMMGEQLAAFAASAKAQAALAASQSRLADAQDAGNIMRETELISLRFATMNRALVALAQIDASVAQMRATDPVASDTYVELVEPTRVALGTMIEGDREAIRKFNQEEGQGHG